MSHLSWFNGGQYSAWSRTRQLQRTPYVAQPNTNTSRVATAMAQAANANQNGTGAVVINMGNAATAESRAKDKDKKAQDSLFGPNIGVVSSGPAWTDINEKKMLADELTPEVVQSWIEKSKESTQPTTTLQALVNLKRPTLRLSPLTGPDDAQQQDTPHRPHHHHGLEFEYDCDAPKCGIYVHVLLAPDHPDATNPASATTGLSKLLVFESVVDGGFGKILKLEEGAMLELGRFEYVPGKNGKTPPTPLSTPAPTPAVTGANVGPTVASSPGAGDSPSAQGAATTELTPTNSNGRPTDRRRRFTPFKFRRRLLNHSVSGPALAVVDAEPPSTGAVEPAQGRGHGKDGKGEEGEMEGVRVMIRLVALDEQGTELASPNEQVTYLHVVRFGVKGVDVPTEGGEGEEDARPWVVKVVKREATIGPHTFHLHEIYGLSSSSSTTTTTTTTTASLPVPVPPPSALLPTHTYPPPTTPSSAQPVMEDEPSSECLVCLSSPREVVLLPCRHLVACKECALNMVEYGAGGNITQTEEPSTGAAAVVSPSGEGGSGGEAAEGVVAAAAGTGAGGEAAGGSPATPAVTTPSPSAPVNPRRKRKTKGWSCPVCRQPYTSLLRITTTPPSMDEKDEEEAPTVESGDAAANPSASGDAGGAAGTGAAGGNGRTGLLGGAFRPAFLRSFSRGAASSGDVESQSQTPSQGATGRT